MRRTINIREVIAVLIALEFGLLAQWWALGVLENYFYEIFRLALTEMSYGLTDLPTINMLTIRGFLQR